MTEHTMFLFARPSLLEGIARIVDIGGTLNAYNTALTGSQADGLAMQTDVAALREDLAAARVALRRGLEDGAKTK